MFSSSCVIVRYWDSIFFITLPVVFLNDFGQVFQCILNTTGILLNACICTKSNLSFRIYKCTRICVLSFAEKQEGLHRPTNSGVESRNIPQINSTARTLWLIATARDNLVYFRNTSQRVPRRSMCQWKLNWRSKWVSFENAKAVGCFRKTTSSYIYWDSRVWCRFRDFKWVFIAHMNTKDLFT